MSPTQSLRRAQSLLQGQQNYFALKIHVRVHNANFWIFLNAIELINNTLLAVAATRSAQVQLGTTTAKCWIERARKHDDGSLVNPSSISVSGNGFAAARSGFTYGFGPIELEAHAVL